MRYLIEYIKTCSWGINYQLPTIIVGVFTFIVFSSCNFEGTYVSEDNEYTTDTIIIKEDMTYTQKIYDKNRKVLLLEHTEKWESNGINTVMLLDFYPGSDWGYKQILENCANDERITFIIDSCYQDKNGRITMDLFKVFRNGKIAIAWAEYIDLPEEYHCYFEVK